MADLYPTQGNISTLATSPPAKTTAVFRRQPSVYGQMGLATSYTSSGESYSCSRKPDYYQLAAWDNCRRKEPIVKQGLEYIVLALLAKIGPYSHPDNQIDDFVQANIENKLKRWIGDLAATLLWSGFSVSEINYTSKEGPKGIPQTWFDDFVNYHPLQISLHLNDFNCVKDGDKVTGSTFKSGIYVPAPMSHQTTPRKNREYMGSLVRLTKGKRVYLNYHGEGNNPWGRSILESVLPYHLFKEAFRDMLATALDRYGTPLLYVIVPPLDTRELTQDPDGTTRPKTLQEMTAEQMQNLSSESALVFTQISKDQPVQVGALTTGNNFADAFSQGIELCDNNMLHGMGVPNLLIKDSNGRLGTGGASERQLELFDTFITALFDLVVGGFVEQAIAQLIQYNFDVKSNPKALNAGSIQRRPTRAAELDSVIKAITALTNLGYVNPANPVDFRFVRELVTLPDRKPDPLMDGVLPINRKFNTLEQGVMDPKEDNVEIANPAANYTIEAQKNKVKAIKANTKKEGDVAPSKSSGKTKKVSE